MTRVPEPAAPTATEDHVVVVLCTAPSREVAAALAEGAVRARLAACVNLVEGVRSFYMWDGALCDELEVQLVLKTTRAHAPALSAHLAHAHPYDVPEVLVLDTDPVSSSAAYQRFVRDGVG
ncbi:MAG: divalent-cation tolerance protein CutA [Polyangiales bacterium]|nr:divalent-cation tolerance protein CutA [Myxococcales bacterium]MCB9661110.1 divalent-cation tolerance protein CutA [Sandaracinaceae bacterium]